MIPQSESRVKRFGAKREDLSFFEGKNSESLLTVFGENDIIDIIISYSVVALLKWSGDARTVGRSLCLN